MTGTFVGYVGSGRAVAWFLVAGLALSLMISDLQAATSQAVSSSFVEAVNTAAAANLNAREAEKLYKEYFDVQAELSQTSAKLDTAYSKGVVAQALVRLGVDEGRLRSTKEKLQKREKALIEQIRKLNGSDFVLSADAIKSHAASTLQNLEQSMSNLFREVVRTGDVNVLKRLADPRADAAIINKGLAGVMAGISGDAVFLGKFKERLAQSKEFRELMDAWALNSVQKEFETELKKQSSGESGQKSGSITASSNESIDLMKKDFRARAEFLASITDTATTLGQVGRDRLNDLTVMFNTYLTGGSPKGKAPSFSAISFFDGTLLSALNEAKNPEWQLRYIANPAVPEAERQGTLVHHLSSKPWESPAQVERLVVAAMSSIETTGNNEVLRALGQSKALVQVLERVNRGEAERETGRRVRETLAQFVREGTAHAILDSARQADGKDKTVAQDAAVESLKGLARSMALMNDPRIMDRERFRQLSVQLPIEIVGTAAWDVLLEKHPKDALRYLMEKAPGVTTPYFEQLKPNEVGTLLERMAESPLKEVHRAALEIAVKLSEKGEKVPSRFVESMLKLDLTSEERSKLLDLANKPGMELNVDRIATSYQSRVASETQRTVAESVAAEGPKMDAEVFKLALKNLQKQGRKLEELAKQRSEEKIVERQIELSLKLQAEASSYSTNLKGLLKVAMSSEQAKQVLADAKRVAEIRVNGDPILREGIFGALAEFKSGAEAVLDYFNSTKSGTKERRAALEILSRSSEEKLRQTALDALRGEVRTMPIEGNYAFQEKILRNLVEKSKGVSEAHRAEISQQASAALSGEVERLAAAEAAVEAERVRLVKEVAAASEKADVASKEVADLKGKIGGKQKSGAKPKGLSRADQKRMATAVEEQKATKSALEAARDALKKHGDKSAPPFDTRLIEVLAKSENSAFQKTALEIVEAHVTAVTQRLQERLKFDRKTLSASEEKAERQRIMSRGLMTILENKNLSEASQKHAIDLLDVLHKGSVGPSRIWSESPFSATLLKQLAASPHYFLRAKALEVGLAQESQTARMDVLEELLRNGSVLENEERILVERALNANLSEGVLKGHADPFSLSWLAFKDAQARAERDALPLNKRKAAEDAAKEAEKALRTARESEARRAVVLAKSPSENARAQAIALLGEGEPVQDKGARLDAILKRSAPEELRKAQEVLRKDGSKVGDPGYEERLNGLKKEYAEQTRALAEETLKKAAFPDFYDAKRPILTALISNPSLGEQERRVLELADSYIRTSAALDGRATVVAELAKSQSLEAKQHAITFIETIFQEKGPIELALKLPWLDILGGLRGSKHEAKIPELVDALKAAKIDEKSKTAMLDTLIEKGFFPSSSSDPLRAEVVYREPGTLPPTAIGKLKPVPFRPEGGQRPRGAAVFEREPARVPDQDRVTLQQGSGREREGGSSGQGHSGSSTAITGSNSLEPSVGEEPPKKGPLVKGTRRRMFRGSFVEMMSRPFRRSSLSGEAATVPSPGEVQRKALQVLEKAESVRRNESGTAPR